MTDRSSGQGLPDDWSHGSYHARERYYGAEATEAYSPGTAGSGQARASDPFGADTTAAYGPGTAGSRQARAADSIGAETTAAYGARNAGPSGAATADRHRSANTDSKGFLGALFDFGFTSFVTPKVIKVLYVLIMIGTAVSALVFTIAAFKVSAVFGFLTLVIGDPLFIIIVMAIYRIILEFFVVIFRMSEDIRSLRERGDLR